MPLRLKNGMMSAKGNLSNVNILMNNIKDVSKECNESQKNKQITNDLTKKSIQNKKYIKF